MSGARGARPDTGSEGTRHLMKLTLTDFIELLIEYLRDVLYFRVT